MGQAVVNKAFTQAPRLCQAPGTNAPSKDPNYEREARMTMVRLKAASADESVPQVAEISEASSMVSGQHDGNMRTPHPPEDKSATKASAGALAGRLGSWHLPVGQTLANFCATLNRRGINYAILPSVGVAPNTQQTAVLVSDKDICRVRDLITRIPLGQQLAVYSPTGLPGFSFQQHWRHNSEATNMAVLPPHLADALLEGAQVNERGFRVPAPTDSLLWEIYRALYLVGDGHFVVDTSKDRLPILVGPSAQRISDLARATSADVSGSSTLEALDQYLFSHGWQPPYDVLRRISSWNSWAASKVREIDSAEPPEEPGMVAFFIRQEVLTSGLQSKILGAIEGSGFELLRTIALDEDQVEAATRGFRGGNWGPGAFLITGGPPAQIVIALDELPYPVREEARQSYPHMDNGRILEAKLMCRRFIRDRLPPERQFNPLHSTDTGAEAWRVIRQFAGHEEQELRDVARTRRAAMTTEFEVVRALTQRGARAKIEMIRYGGGLAVKKTFRHNSLRFLEREVAFMEAVSPIRSEILPVIEQGANYFITPFVEGRPLRQKALGLTFPKLLTLKETRKLADLLRFLFSRGYDPVDLGPYNVLIDRSGRLTVIDFEFIQQCDKPVQPETSACLNGVRAGFEGEWPPGVLFRPTRVHSDPYGERWFGYTGLSRKSFLYDPPALQWANRLVNYPLHLGRKAINRTQETLSAATKRALRRRLPVLTRIAANSLRSSVKPPNAPC